MTAYDFAERLMAMDDATWRRHANPLSVQTRFTCLPLIVLAAWSHVWIGWWSLIPVGLALWWTWYNPRAFPEPQHFRTWWSRAVLGERIFLVHRQEVPFHHQRAANILSAMSVPGVILLVFGLLMQWAPGAAFGTVLAMLPKAWFCDRMVWLYDDWVREGRAVPGMET